MTRAINQGTWHHRLIDASLMLRRLSVSQRSLLSIGLFASVVAINPFALKAHDGLAYDLKSRDQLNKPDIGLCDSLRDDDRQWDNTFTTTIV